MRAYTVAITKSKTRYKRNFDDRLHCIKHKSETGLYAYLRLYYAAPDKCGLLKLAPKSYGSFS